MKSALSKLFVECLRVPLTVSGTLHSGSLLATLQHQDHYCYTTDEEIVVGAKTICPKLW